MHVQLYQLSWKLEKLKLYENTPRFGRRVSIQFLIFPISTHNCINTENVLHFLTDKQH